MGSHPGKLLTMRMPSSVDRKTALKGSLGFALALFFVLLPLGAGAQGAAEGSGLRQLVLALLFLYAAVTVARFPERWPLVARALPLGLVALLLYTLMSTLWSPERYVSFKRVVQLYGVAILGLALVVGGNGRYRLQRVVEPVLWAVMLLALVTTAAFPGYAFADNGLRAFMATKNSFAQFAVMCVLFPLALLHAEGGRRRVPRLLLAALGLVGLALSRSATSALALSAVAAVYLTWRLLKGLHRSWWPVLLAVGLALVAAAFAAGVLLGFASIEELSRQLARLIGRDVTLTGRAYLWELMLREVRHHPWFGTGYGGFWLGLEGASGQIAYLVKWGYPGQAHNGYLDILNELGVVGLGLLGVFLIEHGRALVRLRHRDPVQAAFHAALLVMVLVLNLAEAAMLRTTHFWWILLVASALEVRLLAYTAPASRPPARARLSQEVAS